MTEFRVTDETKKSITVKLDFDIYNENIVGKNDHIYRLNLVKEISDKLNKSLSWKGCFVQFEKTFVLLRIN